MSSSNFTVWQIRFFSGKEAIENFSRNKETFISFNNKTFFKYLFLNHRKISKSKNEGLWLKLIKILYYTPPATMCNPLPFAIVIFAPWVSCSPFRGPRLNAVLFIFNSIPDDGTKHYKNLKTLTRILQSSEVFKYLLKNLSICTLLKILFYRNSLSCFKYLYLNPFLVINIKFTTRIRKNIVQKVKYWV